MRHCFVAHYGRPDTLLFLLHMYFIDLLMPLQIYRTVTRV